MSPGIFKSNPVERGEKGAAAETNEKEKKKKVITNKESKNLCFILVSYGLGHSSVPQVSV